MVLVIGSGSLLNDSNIVHVEVEPNQTSNFLSR